VEEGLSGFGRGDYFSIIFFFPFRLIRIGRNVYFLQLGFTCEDKYMILGGILGGKGQKYIYIYLRN
jgi:hypothetical protein